MRRTGSPPRMRGKALLHCTVQTWRGITPAYAGKSGTGSGPAPGPKDHPRVCGEKCLPPILRARHIGSPPRMRGKVPCRSAAGRAGGITPAYAGKSLSKLRRRAGTRDHPRVCGEKGRAFMKKTESRGSPPRMRGKAVRLPLPAVGGRITPAYAGKSPTAGRHRRRCRDHPRVCGEKSRTFRRRSRKLGSPPRMRGKERRTT